MSAIECVLKRVEYPDAFLNILLESKFSPSSDLVTDVWTEFAYEQANRVPNETSVLQLRNALDGIVDTAKSLGMHLKFDCYALKSVEESKRSAVCKSWVREQIVDKISTATKLTRKMKETFLQDELDMLDEDEFKAVGKKQLAACVDKIKQPGMLKADVVRQCCTISKHNGKLLFVYLLWKHSMESIDRFIQLPPPSVIGHPCAIRPVESPCEVAPPASGPSLESCTLVYTSSLKEDGKLYVGNQSKYNKGGLVCSVPGTSMVALLHGKECEFIDVESGKQLFEFTLPVQDVDDNKSTFVSPKAESKSSKTINWIDCQRNQDSGLIFAWGGVDAYGMLEWCHCCGLEDNGDITEVDGEEVDDMYFQRLQKGKLLDFRDHGNVLSAIVRHTEHGVEGTVVYDKSFVAKHADLALVWGVPTCYIAVTSVVKVGEKVVDTAIAASNIASICATFI